MPGRIELENVFQVVQSLNHMAREIENLDDAFSNIGEDFVREARARAPKLTGRLAGSIQANQPRNNKVEIIAGNGLRYAGVQEFGWAQHNIEGTNYMFGTLDANRLSAMQEIEGSVDDVIRRFNAM